MEVILKPLHELIILEDRQRQTFVDLDLGELADSIKEHGLFHAIVLRGDGNTINSGERRYRAISHLEKQGDQFKYNDELIPLGFIPTIIVSYDSDLKYREAELDENERRVDLTWQEKSNAVGELHALRLEQRAEKGEVQTVRDTALELVGLDEEQAKSGHGKQEDISLASLKVKDVQEDLRVLEYSNDIEVQKAPTRQIALKIIYKKLEEAHRVKLAEDYVLDKVESPHTVILGDMLDEVLKLPSDHFHCIVTDPPYGIDADTFQNQAAVKHAYKDSKEYSDALLRFIAIQGLRVTKAQAHLYLFLDLLRFPEIKAMFESYGWYVWKTPLIWNKGANSGILPRVKHGPRRTYEVILYGIKGDKETKLVAPDVLSYGPDKTVQRGAHKPASVYADLIRRSCTAGDRVFDPCCGVGPIITAANLTNTIATGIELDPVAYTQAVERQTAFAGEEELLVGLFGEEGE